MVRAVKRIGPAGAAARLAVSGSGASLMSRQPSCASTGPEAQVTGAGLGEGVGEGAGVGVGDERIAVPPVGAELLPPPPHAASAEIDAAPSSQRADVKIVFKRCDPYLMISRCVQCSRRSKLRPITSALLYQCTDFHNLCASGYHVICLTISFQENTGQLRNCRNSDDLGLKRAERPAFGPGDLCGEKARVPAALFWRDLSQPRCSQQGIG